jgi:hypothetical protein
MENGKWKMENVERSEIPFAGEDGRCEEQVSSRE